MSTLKTTILLSALACLAMSSTAFAQDNVPVKAPESLKNVPFKIEGVEGFLHSLGIDPKTEIKLSKKELRSLAESNYNDKTAQHFMSVPVTAWAASLATINPKLKVRLGWPTSAILR